MKRYIREFANDVMKEVSAEKEVPMKKLSDIERRINQAVTFAEREYIDKRDAVAIILQQLDNLHAFQYGVRKEKEGIA